MSKKESMNHLERFRAVMNFQPFDRLPRLEWATWWSKTIERWLGEGLPVSDRYEVDRYFDMDPYYQFWFFARLRPLPKTSPKGQGLIASMADYEELRPFLYPKPDIHAGQFELWGKQQAEGKAVIWITLDGFFWFPRSLMGIERHLYAFYDQPELMHRINTDLADWHASILRWITQYCPPAFMTFAEDMSYNHGPMLSKPLFEEFLAPYYRRVVPLLKKMGTTVLVDSDGQVDELMPWLMSVGFDGVLPLERQAGCDAEKMRRAMPKVRMIGHYDKMVMPHGEAAMRQEFERLLPTMKTGGFIPSVDHQTPPGVSLEQYRVFLRLLKEYTKRAGA